MPSVAFTITNPPPWAQVWSATLFPDLISTPVDFINTAVAVVVPDGITGNWVINVSDDQVPSFSENLEFGPVTHNAGVAVVYNVDWQTETIQITSGGDNDADPNFVEEPPTEPPPEEPPVLEGGIGSFLSDPKMLAIGAVLIGIFVVMRGK